MGDPRARSIDREIASLAVPAALALVTDPLYDLCDTAIIGHIGTAQLAGAAVAVRLLAFGYAAFVFLLFGTTAAVARHRGAGEDREAVEQAVSAVWLSLAIGAVTAVVFGLVGRTLIGAMGARGAVAEHAWTYLSVSLAGMPAFTTVMAGVGYLRGGGDARTPLLVSLATVSLNLVLELALVFGAGFGVGASAFGTVIAKWVGAAVYVTILGRAARGLGVGFRPRRRLIRGQLVVGRDLVARTIILLGVIATAQALVARVGTAELAAHAIAFQLWMFAAYATDGLEAAGQTMVATRIGAGRPGEVDEVSRRLLHWALRLGVGLGAVLAVASGALPRLFTPEAAVLTLATSTIWWVAAMQPVNALAFALDGIGVGAGRQRALAGSMAGSAVAFAAVAAPATALGWGLPGVWAALTAFMVVRATLVGRLVLNRSWWWSRPRPGSGPARTARR